MNLIHTFLRSHWKQLILLAVSTLISFGLAEVAFRSYLHLKYGRLMADFQNELWLPMLDKPEIYRLQPGAHGSSKMPEDQEVSWRYVLNDDGFRSPDVGERRPGVTRILCMGDSYAFGWALDETETPYPRVIERILNEDAVTSRVEVINAGVPGYNARQEYELLCDLAPKYEPDIVVVGFVLNDAEPMAVIPAPPWLRYRFATFWTVEQLKEVLNRRIFKNRPFFHTVGNENDFDYLKGFAPESPKWRDCRDALHSIGELCRKRHIRLLFCILPDVYYELGSEYPWNSIHRQVGQWANDFDIPAMDILPEFRDSVPGQYRVEGEGHPNALAHQKIGELIAKRLRSMIDPEK